MRPIVTMLLTFTLYACGDAPPAADPSTPTAAAEPAQEVQAAEPPASFATILAAQPAEVQARYQYRHPQQTMEFFGIEPGMKIAEALPGGGWYSKLLLPLLGADGTLVGVDYPMALWPNFDFANEEFMATKATWAQDWPAQAEEFRGPGDAGVEAFVFGAMPEQMRDSLDAVLLIRALHNLARFSDPASEESDFLGQVMRDAYAALKPGGIVGIVQHEAPADMPDTWADGSRGYLKKDFVIAQMEQNGFEFVASSDINNNPQDQPGADDIVWRLPPSYATSGDNAERKAAMDEIGESNRMTLKFIKPRV